MQSMEIPSFSDTFPDASKDRCQSGGHEVDRLCGALPRVPQEGG